ncbi:Cytotoxic [Gigaspora margarita]|uniref:Cytotoxic n=1 Tax=Gigaspora margarita TaxID=4874 RepID=A0A8H3WUI2_GIGMA|nr:Cytotoxic [Gigaspora margarita]
MKFRLFYIWLLLITNAWQALHHTEAKPQIKPTKTGLGGVITEGLGKNCYCFYTDYPAYNETSQLKRQNKQNSCSPKGPGESPFWKSLKPYKGSVKTNGLSGKKRRYYEWDYTHNDIEVYDSNGDHLGSAEPCEGKMIKPPVTGRNIRDKIRKREI